MLDRIRSWLPGAVKKEPAKLTLEGSELLEWVNQKRSLTLLDVRDQKAYRGGHVKGSVLIPGSELPQRMHELRSDQLIVVLADSEAKAFKAARMMRQAGLEVMHLKGGIQAWPGKIVK
jgi:rhodanese-related sulfurtransferase